MSNKRQKQDRNVFSISSYTYIVHMQLRCISESSEFVLTTQEMADMTIENAAGQVMYRLFDIVIVDRVSMRWVSPPTTFPAYHILINAHCIRRTPASPARLATLEYTLEHRIGGICSELFNIVHIEHVVVKFLPSEEWEHILTIR
jgi:hypothetical protein